MADRAESLVVDASVAAKWHLTDEEYTGQAELLLTSFSTGRLQLMAPDHIRYEVPSAINAATLGRTPRLTEEQGQEAIEEFLRLRIPTVGDDRLILDAYRLSHQHRCAFYDALYLALAQQLRIHLVTADARLYQRIRHLGTVDWLEDYSPAT